MNEVFFIDQIINPKQRLSISLTKIKGLGRKRALFICQKLGLQKNSVFKDLDSDAKDLLKLYIEEHFKINKHLNREISKNINFLVNLKSYRGKRHKLSYPVRGQRTKTNSKTQRVLSRNRFSNKLKEVSSNFSFKDKFLSSAVNKKI